MSRGLRCFSCEVMNRPHGSMVDVAVVMCHVGLFFHCIFYPHGLREICIKDKRYVPIEPVYFMTTIYFCDVCLYMQTFGPGNCSGVAFFRVLTDMRDSNLTLFMEACARKCVLVATKTVVDRITGMCNTFQS
jgi:hypothetical protein